MTTIAFAIPSAILAQDVRDITLAVDDIPSLCHPDNSIQLVINR